MCQTDYEQKHSTTLTNNPDITRGNITNTNILQLQKLEKTMYTICFVMEVRSQ